MIKDMTLETYHLGSYALLRSNTTTNILTALVLIVEAEESNVLVLQLFNREDISADKDAHKGTGLIAKEPYLKVSADGDNMVRVEHLSDVLFIQEWHPLAPVPWKSANVQFSNCANRWKPKGNASFVRNDYQFAIEW
jgi:hypothetical protein